MGICAQARVNVTQAHSHPFGVLWGRKGVSGAAVAIAFKVSLKLQDFDESLASPILLVSV